MRRFILILGVVCLYVAFPDQVSAGCEKLMRVTVTCMVGSCTQTRTVSECDLNTFSNRRCEGCGSLVCCSSVLLPTDCNVGFCPLSPSALNYPRGVHLAYIPTCTGEYVAVEVTDQGTS